ncbi:MAG: hypothetical protein DMF82_05165 [Acidobacteria bacterium]|nr:MAG: hypothetical protein DMF82_05165 [Acidobacteriota bacterium]
MTPPPDASFLPRMPLVTPRTQTELAEAVGRLQWFHKIDFGELVTAGCDYDANWSWVARRLQVNARLLRGATILEHGPADGLWSCWLTKLGCRSIVAADVIDSDQYRLVVESFGLPVEYVPGLISTATPSKVRRVFDVVASFGVLYHVHDPLSTLIMYQRYLRRNGFLLLETGAIPDDNPTLYYTGEGLVYGKEGGNQFIPSIAFLHEVLAKSLGFAVLSSEFRKEYVHPALRKHVGRSFIVAWKERLPTIHEYPTVLAELGMAGDEFGPIEWAYGP